MTQEGHVSAIAENVYHQCLDEAGEQASVEKVVSFFRSQRDIEHWRLCNKEVDLLYDLLDPQNSATGVNLPMLEDGLHKWIRYIECRNSDEELPLDSVEENNCFDQCNFSKVFDHSEKDNSGVTGASSEQPGDSGMPLSDNLVSARRSDGSECEMEDFGEVNYVSGSRGRGNGDGDSNMNDQFISPTEFSSYNDVADILSRLHQIRHENCVLSDEKKKLQSQLDAAEENIQQQQLQLDEWEKKNRTFQNLSRENKELHAEVEELRGSIDGLEASNRQMQSLHSQTERDVLYWQERAQEYSNMLAMQHRELDQRNTSVEELKRDLLKHKEAIDEYGKVNRNQQAEIEDRASAVRELRERLEHLTEKNEQLIRLNEEQENQVHWYKTEIHKQRLSFGGMSQDVAAFNSTTTDVRQQRNSVHLSNSIILHRPDSLQSELVEKMSNDLETNLPSPFCEKETANSGRNSFNLDRSFIGHSRESISSVVSSDGLSTKTMIELEIDFLKLMNSLALDAELKERCIDVFQKVLLLHQRQCTKLNSQIREISEERNFIQARHQEALQQLRDTSCLLETDIADKMASLEDQIKSEKLHSIEMEAQLAKYQEDELARMDRTEKSTQVRLEPVGCTDKLPDNMELKFDSDQSTTRESNFEEEKEHIQTSHAHNEFLNALDLAGRTPQFSSTQQSTDKPGQQVYGVSSGSFQPVLPEFDMEFSYSFDTPLQRRRKTLDPSDSAVDSAVESSTVDFKVEEDSIESIQSPKLSGKFVRRLSSIKEENLALEETSQEVETVTEVKEKHAVTENASEVLEKDAPQTDSKDSMSGSGIKFKLFSIDAFVDGVEKVFHRSKRTRKRGSAMEGEILSQPSSPNSSVSYQSSHQPVFSSFKESDGSEDRENNSTATTVSSSEECVVANTAALQSPPQISPQAKVTTHGRSASMSSIFSPVSAPEVKNTRSTSFNLPGMSEESPKETAAIKRSSVSEVVFKPDDDDEVFSEASSVQPSEKKNRVNFAKVTSRHKSQSITSSVFPSLSNAKLKELNLFPENLQSNNNWSEEETEQKFTQLSLSFRTDRETLEERVKLHIGGRDTAEKNARSEIDAIRQIVNSLGQIPNLSIEIISNLQYTCKVLERTIHRLASKSEILGAVQQEGRLSHAVEVMLLHMDNLRRSHARDNRELEEVKKILRDGRFVGNPADLSADGSLSKRSMSLMGGGSPRSLGKYARLSGSDIFVFPQGNIFPEFGEITHSVPSTPTIDQMSLSSLRRTSTASTRKSTLSSDSPDIRSRFQAVASSAGIQSSVALHLRRLSSDKFNQDGHLLLSNESDSTLGSRRESTDNRNAKLSNASECSVTSIPEKDAIFQKGLEQGLRAKVGNELGTLREEQSALSESLDHLMEIHSIAEECEKEENADKRDFLDILIATSCEYVSQCKDSISFLRARWIAGGVAFLFAIFILLWSVLWSVTVGHPSSAPS